MRLSDYGVLLALIAKQVFKAGVLTGKYYKNWLLAYLNKVFRGV